MNKNLSHILIVLIVILCNINGYLGSDGVTSHNGHHTHKRGHRNNRSKKASISDKIKEKRTNNRHKYKRKTEALFPNSNVTKDANVDNKNLTLYYMSTNNSINNLSNSVNNIDQSKNYLHKKYHKSHKHPKKSKKRGNVTGRVRDEIPSDVDDKTVYPPPSNMWAINKELVDTEHSLHEPSSSSKHNKNDVEEVQSTHEDIILHAEEEKEDPDREDARENAIPHAGVQEDLSEVLLAKAKVPKYTGLKLHSHHMHEQARKELESRNMDSSSDEKNTGNDLIDKDISAEKDTQSQKVSRYDSPEEEKLMSEKKDFHEIGNDFENKEEINEQQDIEPKPHLRLHHKPSSIQSNVHHKLMEKQNDDMMSDTETLHTKSDPIKPQQAEFRKLKTDDSQSFGKEKEKETEKDSDSKRDDKDSAKIVYPSPSFADIKRRKQIELFRQQKMMRGRDHSQVVHIMPKKEGYSDNSNIQAPHASIRHASNNEVNSPKEEQNGLIANALSSQSNVNSNHISVTSSQNSRELQQANLNDNKLVKSEQNIEENAPSTDASITQSNQKATPVTVSSYNAEKNAPKEEPPIPEIAEVGQNLLRSDGKPASEQEILNHAKAIQYIREQHKKAQENIKQNEQVEVTTTSNEKDTKSNDNHDQVAQQDTKELEASSIENKISEQNLENAAAQQTNELKKEPDDKLESSPDATIEKSKSTDVSASSNEKQTAPINCKRELRNCKDFIVEDYKTETIDQSQMDQIMAHGAPPPPSQTRINQQMIKSNEPLQAKDIHLVQQEVHLPTNPSQLTSSQKAKAPSIANVPSYTPTEGPIVEQSSQTVQPFHQNQALTQHQISAPVAPVPLFGPPGTLHTSGQVPSTPQSTARVAPAPVQSNTNTQTNSVTTQASAAPVAPVLTAQAPVAPAPAPPPPAAPIPSAPSQVSNAPPALDAPASATITSPPAPAQMALAPAAPLQTPAVTTGTAALSSPSSQVNPTLTAAHASHFAQQPPAHASAQITQPAVSQVGVSSQQPPQQAPAIQTALQSHEAIPANSQQQITATPNGGVRISPGGAADPSRDITITTEGDNRGNRLPDNRVIMHTWSIEDPESAHTKVISQDAQPLPNQVKAPVVPENPAGVASETASFSESKQSGTNNAPLEPKAEFKSENSNYNEGGFESTNNIQNSEFNQPKPEFEEQKEVPSTSKTNINDYEKQPTANDQNAFDSSSNTQNEFSKNTDEIQTDANPQQSTYSQNSNVISTNERFDNAALSMTNTENPVPSGEIELNNKKQDFADTTQKETPTSNEQFIQLPDIEPPQGQESEQVKQPQINGVPIGTAQEEAPTSFANNQEGQEPCCQTAPQDSIQGALNAAPAETNIVVAQKSESVQPTQENAFPNSNQNLKPSSTLRPAENTINKFKPSQMSKVAGPSKMKAGEILNGFAWPAGVNPGAQYSSEMIDLWKMKGIAPVRGYLKSKIQEKKGKLQNLKTLPNTNTVSSKRPSVMTVLKPKRPTGPSIAYDQSFPMDTRTYTYSKSNSKSKASPNSAQSSASNTNTAKDKNQGATSSTHVDSRHNQPNSGYGYGSGNGYGYGQRSWGWGGGGGWAGNPPPQGMPSPGDFSSAPSNIPNFPSGGGAPAASSPAAPAASPAPAPSGSNSQYTNQKPTPVRPKQSGKLKEKYTGRQNKPVEEKVKPKKETLSTANYKEIRQKEDYRLQKPSEDKYQKAIKPRSTHDIIKTNSKRSKNKR